MPFTYEHYSMPCPSCYPDKICLVEGFRMNSWDRVRLRVLTYSKKHNETRFICTGNMKYIFVHIQYVFLSLLFFSESFKRRIDLIAIHNTPAPKKHSPATKYTPYRPHQLTPAAVLFTETPIISYSLARMFFLF